jgi:hypothetical protein
MDQSLSSTTAVTNMFPVLLTPNNSVPQQKYPTAPYSNLVPMSNTTIIQQIISNRPDMLALGIALEVWWNVDPVSTSVFVAHMASHNRVYTITQITEAQYEAARPTGMIFEQPISNYCASLTDTVVSVLKCVVQLAWTNNSRIVPRVSAQTINYSDHNGKVTVPIKQYFRIECLC